MTAKKPPRLIHRGYKRGDCFAEIAALAATALHMGKGERALLAFYAAQSSGYRPSLQAIAAATGQDRAQVWRNRKALIKHGVAAERSDAVVLDWGRLKIFASLDPALTSKRCICAPLDVSDRLSIAEFKILPFNDLAARLAAMSETEYADLCRRMKHAEARTPSISRFPSPISTFFPDFPPAA